MGNELGFFSVSCIFPNTCLSRHEKTWLNKHQWMIKVQGLLTQFTKIYPLKEFLDPEDVRYNLLIQTVWYDIAYDFKWQVLIKYLQRHQKLLHWPIEAGFVMAGSKMKFINHYKSRFVYISYLNKFLAQVNEDFCSR